MDKDAAQALILKSKENEIMSFATLAHALVVARKKHPVYAKDATEAWGVIRAELFELLHAVEHESEERQREEAIDVAVTALRFVLGEHKPELPEE